MKKTLRKRDKQQSFYTDEEEKEKIMRACKNLGVNFSVFVRITTLREATRILKEEKEEAILKF